MATDEGKKLNDLRVVDLRGELEKRGLDKTGVKASLIERLHKALTDEGKNPDEYEFELNDKKPEKHLSPSEKSDETAEPLSQSETNETPSLNSTMETQEDDVKKNESITGGESPLDLLIEEEEENLLNDENLQSDSQKTLSTVVLTAENIKKVDVKEDEKVGKEVDVTKQEKEETVKEDIRDELLHKETKSKQSEIATTKSAESSTTDLISEVSEKDLSKNDKDNNACIRNNPGRSLWVTNLLPSTRAQELKHLLSRYGKVIGAKVVQSSRNPRTKCYGYVTMETKAAADLCIEKLNNTELKGQIIRVAKVRPEHSLAMKSPQRELLEKDKSKEPKTSVSDKSEPQKESKKEPTNEKKENESPKSPKTNVKEGERNRSRSGSRKSKTSSRSERKPELLTLDKIRAERERELQREQDRKEALRQEERRRRDIQRAHEIEKRQREESMRLEREREKLRAERDRLDRQRAEIMRMERERQKLEREKLEQEKQELRRQQMRLEEAQRPLKRPSSSSNYRRETSGSYGTDDRKRVVTEHHYAEAPPPPLFDVSSRNTMDIPTKKELAKEYKSRNPYSERTKEYNKHSSEFKREYPPTDRHSGGHMTHESSYGNRQHEEIRREPRREPMQTVPPSRMSREARYNDSGNDRSPVAYRPVREERERRTVSDHHSKGDMRSREHRYAEPAPLKEGSRYREGNSWHSSSVSNMGWRPMESGSNERWANSSSRMMMSSSSVPNTMYSGMSCPPPPGNANYSIDRFDYKSINLSRKY